MSTMPDDPIREARAAASLALRPISLEQWRLAIVWWLVSSGGFATILIAMVGAQMLEKRQAWHFASAGSALSLICCLVYPYISKLAARSEALKELMSTQKQYDALLISAWEEKGHSERALSEARVELAFLRTAGRIVEGSNDE
jgi:hypothetical protein